MPRLPLPIISAALTLAAALTLPSPLRAQTTPPAPAAKIHTFAIGDTDFLLDNARFQIRCGEIHSTRVPKEYWRHRLQMAKAMGLNTVCAYLFWNRHEPTPGTFDWSGENDVPEFVRIAQEEGLFVILRPGPYACAEWEMGGFPWWLLKNPNIALRTNDPDYLAHATSYLKEVGRVFQPLLVTHGGPILMVQVENEYGFYGKDASYMGNLRKAMIDAGIDVPLFACNPTHNLKNGFRDDLFNVVNFGSDPAGAFKALREVQPKGPLMNGEFYPGWFDTWGNAHRTGTVESLSKDLDYMLSHDESFSLYMAHGGTTFGLWSGADSPFKPDASSYDYDAPISESGKTTPKFFATRELMRKYLLPGESIPNPPAENPVVAYPQFSLDARALIFDNLPAAIPSEKPQTFETLDLAHGMMLYRTTLPAGPAAALQPDEVHDFGFVYLDGKPAGTFDRRSRNFRLLLPAREKPTQLDILVEAVGRVNFSVGVHDRKGLHEPVRLIPETGEPTTLTNWQQFPLPLDYAPGDKYLASLKFIDPDPTVVLKPRPRAPAFYKGTLHADKPNDTYLDLRNFSKGVAWVNGHCLGRFWNIGPTQTMYTPGPWLHAGDNQVLILDVLGPTSPTSAGLDTPILNELHPEKDFGHRLRDGAKLTLNNLQPTLHGAFTPTSGIQEARFDKPVTAQQLCFEALSSNDGKSVACAEFEILDADGKPLSHATWTIPYVSAEDVAKQDGSADNAIDGQTANAWHTPANTRLPVRLLIDLGKPTPISGIRYVPPQGNDQTPGRVKDFNIYTSPTPLTQPPTP